MAYEALTLPVATPRWTILPLPTSPINLIKKDNKKQSYRLRDLSKISRGEGGGNFKFGFGNEVT